MNYVQPLESRRLLSATFAVVKHVAKPTPAIPNLVGKFQGSGMQQKPPRSGARSLKITVTAETKAGAISGTILTQGNPTQRLTGTINAKDHVAFKFVDENRATTTLAATYHPATHVLGGTYAVAAVKGHPAQSGVFSVTLVK